MRNSFPSIEQLGGMSIRLLRSLDIQDGEEEALVQEILNTKLDKYPPILQTENLIIPDIKTKEEENKWQKIIDDRKAERAKKLAEVDSAFETPVEIPVVAEPIAIPDVSPEIPTEVTPIPPEEIVETPPIEIPEEPILGSIKKGRGRTKVSK